MSSLPSPEETQQTLLQLADLSPIEYDQIRKPSATALGIRVTQLDAEVDKRRKSAHKHSKKTAHIAPNNEPGAALLNDVQTFIKRFLVMSEDQARVCTLWVAHTYMADAANYTPYVWINSAVKQSGKSRLIEVLHCLTNNPLKADSISSAALARIVAAESPTLFLDELDAMFKRDSEMSESVRGILNSGFQRGGVYIRCDGVSLEPVKFATFGPKVLAGIGSLPDTITDRSIPIALKRRTKDEPAEPFRLTEVDADASKLRDRLAGWAAVHFKECADFRIPRGMQLSDRQIDISEPLLAIAAACGEAWLDATKESLYHLFSSQEAEDQAKAVMLLQDIRVVFDARKTPELGSNELAHDLALMDGRPWPEWYRGQAITVAQIARQLRPFQIFTDQIRDAEGKKQRRYLRSRFEDAWQRYCPLEAVQAKLRDLRPETLDDDDEEFEEAA